MLLSDISIGRGAIFIGMAAANVKTLSTGDYLYMIQVKINFPPAAYAAVAADSRALSRALCTQMLHLTPLWSCECGS